MIPKAPFSLRQHFLYSHDSIQFIISDTIGAIFLLPIKSTTGCRSLRLSQKWLTYHVALHQPFGRLLQVILPQKQQPRRDVGHYCCLAFTASTTSSTIRFNNNNDILRRGWKQLDSVRIRMGIVVACVIFQQQRQVVMTTTTTQKKKQKQNLLLLHRHRRRLLHLRIKKRWNSKPKRNNY